MYLSIIIISLLMELLTETGVEALLNLQSQLGSLSIPTHEESVQGLREQIQHQCHIVMWERKKMKRKQEKVKEQQSFYLPKRLRDEERRKVLKQTVQRTYVYVNRLVMLCMINHSIINTIGAKPLVRERSN